MARGPFSGLRIVDRSTTVAASYCGKLLADLGADVVKVEDPAGDPLRHAASDPERSPLFLYCNTSKRSIALDLAEDSDRATFEALLSTSDALIHDEATPPTVAEGCDLLVASITPYGLRGPRAGTPGGDLTLGHGGGLFNLLPTRSESVERAPVKLGGHQVGYQGGLYAGFALGAFLLERRRQRAAGHRPAGRVLDLSLQDVALSLMAPGLAGTRYLGLTWCRVPDRPPAMGRLQTRDGYVVLNAFDDHHFDSFRELLGRPGWCAGDEWLDMAYRTNHLLEIAPDIDAWAAEQSRDDLYHRAAKLGIPVGPIHDAQDVLDSPQLAARDYFATMDHPKAGSVRVAGWPYRTTAGAPAIRRPAPLLGEHTDEVSAELSEDRPAPDGSPSPVRLPLEGVRVAEFAWMWAGPYAGVLLAALGAEVIKVEGPKRLDLTRRSVVWPRADERPHAIGVDDGMGYNTMNLGKRSLTLDLSQPEGREIAQRLTATCDIVYDNMRPDALGKLGLGYEDLRARREDIIVASSSGRGHGGPESSYLGYAMVHQAAGGGAYISGYPDDHPTHSGGDVDLMNAVALAFALVAALHHRRETGEGQFIDFSQCDGVTSLLGEVLLEVELGGALPERNGNRHATSAPHGVYRCWGVDRWLALEVHTDEDFARLCDLLGEPERAAHERFATAASRKENEDELDAWIEDWTRLRDRDAVARELTAAGLAAAPSRDADDLYADSHLRERGSLVEIDHPTLGPLVLPGMPFRVTDLDLELRHAPLLGQDNDALLAELGLSDAEISDYRARGITT
ncbi:MAG: CoA transferase [Acidobacteriota bacterium]